ncbi:hypothetical protein IW15_17990 [Chryseobacterium soli]|uniref:Uncharacterized protein n=1 Tax=Chryseobacterium soli TaxID=445961 RepID=A0A086A2Y7_9FLAO|nr:hypothetical protein [Chryseobacterium soli]KFF11051.1 hypothetical protein IW15_17990 [Chryseobacterium soli]
MKKLTPFLVTLFFIFSCNKVEKRTKNSVVQKSTNENVLSKQDSVKTKTTTLKKDDEIAKAKKWLIYSIENYLNKQNGLQENTNEEADGNTPTIFTKKYEEYKSDAINIDLDTDGSLTLQQFQKKWENDFDCQYVGYDSGFLVGAQDWGLIKVTKCDYKTTEKEQLIFSVIISDTENKFNYNRDIKVIPSGKSFLISDVLEQN